MAITLEQLGKQEGDDLGPIEEVWIAEGKRRRDEVRSGTVQTVPGEEALRKVRDSLGRSDMTSKSRIKKR